MRIGTVIVLNAIEAAIAKRLAQLRAENNSVRGFIDMNQSGIDSIAIQIAGIAAELAFCKGMNLYPDLTWSYERGEVPRFDARLPSGMRVDVKHTALDRGRLIAVPWKEVDDRPILFALMTGRKVDEVWTMTFRGVMMSGALFQPSRQLMLKEGAARPFCADQSELEEIIEFLE